MMHTRRAHEREPAPSPDGSYRAVTLINRGPLGIVVWAGALAPPAADKADEDIEAADYHSRMAVSFMSWRDVLDYFQASPFAPLIERAMARSRRADAATLPPERDAG